MTIFSAHADGERRGARIEIGAVAIGKVSGENASLGTLQIRCGPSGVRRRHAPRHQKKTRSAAETGDVEMAPQDDDALALVRRRLAAAEGYRHVLRFDDVRMRYKPHLPYALRGLTFAIEAGTSTAVVGRTGAGKSSLIVVILRLVP